MFVKKLSVFFPSFNEEGNIEITVKKAIDVLKDLNLDYEIIIIDDGSSDRTGEIVDNLAKANPRIRVIHHHTNLGYGEALKSGFYNASHDVVVYTDGDRQFDFSEVKKFLEKLKDFDLVIGYRKRRQDPFLRRLFGKGWKLTLFVFFGLRLKDADCGFKMVSKKVLNTIPHLESQRGAMINAELAIKAKKYGFKVGEVGVTHYPRLSGKPTGASIRVIIKSYIDLLRLWWKLKDQKLLFLSLIFILFLASFLRFYNISEYMTFLGDEGRDAIVIKNILVNKDMPFIGPPTSVGNIYLGPLYYYLMVLPMAIFYLNPVAAAGMNAFFGVATVAFIYYLGKSWFNKEAGLLSAYLYAISPVTIVYSRSSWNPNPAPFFGLLSIFSLSKLHQTGNFLWLILTGLAIGAALQMHYLALVLIPIMATLWLYEVFYRKFFKLPTKNLVVGILLGIFSFILIMSPLILFDLRHQLLNYRAIVQLISSGDVVKVDILTNLAKVPSIFFYNLIGRFISAENLYLTVIVSLLVIFAFIYKFSWPKFALGIWLVTGLVGLTFYQASIYDHYLGFLNPAPFLILGSIMLLMVAKKRMRWLVNIGVIIFLVALTLVNLQRNPLMYLPNNQLKRTQEVAKFIIKQSDNKAFNFALLAQRNYDAAYQFYLDLYGYKPKQVPFDVAEQLFVVCEDEICDPIYSPKYEIAAFGWSKIEWEQNLYDVKIYKLVHNPSGKP